MNIVLISEAGGGKDFISDYLVRKYGYTRYAFADNVKLLAEVWFPELYGNGDSKPRWLLQALGTKFREIDKDVWIKAMLDNIDSNHETAKKSVEAVEHVVVTDCRMPNEYEALKERGFTFIRISVDEDVRLERLVERGDLFSKDDLNHHTESFYNSFECDYEIHNNGSIQEVYDSIDNIIGEIQRSRDSA